MLYYQYRISEELPTGKKKESPVKFQKYETGKEPPPKPPKEPTPPPMQATGQAPQSEYFQPTNIITPKQSIAATVYSEGDYSSGSNNKVTGKSQRDVALSMLADGHDTNNIINNNNDAVMVPPPVPAYAIESNKPKGPPPKPPKK